MKNDAPERIWAWQQINGRDRPMGWGGWCTARLEIKDDETEYVRAELHDALTAERDALRRLLREVEADLAAYRIRAALKGQTDV